MIWSSDAFSREVEAFKVVSCDVGGHIEESAGVREFGGGESFTCTKRAIIAQEIHSKRPKIHLIVYPV